MILNKQPKELVMNKMNRINQKNKLTRLKLLIVKKSIILIKLHLDILVAKVGLRLQDIEITHLSMDQNYMNAIYHRTVL